MWDSKRDEDELLNIGEAKEVSYVSECCLHKKCKEIFAAASLASTFLLCNKAQPVTMSCQLLLMPVECFVLSSHFNIFLFGSFPL